MLLSLYMLLHKPCVNVFLQFETPQFLIDGKSALSKYNESRLYWSPAPPKLDVAPANVKDVLFPDYQVNTLTLISVDKITLFCSHSVL